MYSYIFEITQHFGLHLLIRKIQRHFQNCSSCLLWFQIYTLAQQVIFFTFSIVPDLCNYGKERARLFLMYIIIPLSFWQQLFVNFTLKNDQEKQFLGYLLTVYKPLYNHISMLFLTRQYQGVIFRLLSKDNLQYEDMAYWMRFLVWLVGIWFGLDF